MMTPPEKLEENEMFLTCSCRALVFWWPRIRKATEWYKCYKCGSTIVVSLSDLLNWEE